MARNWFFVLCFEAISYTKLTLVIYDMGFEMANENPAPGIGIGIKDIVHATTQGVLRALDARGTAISPGELVRSGFIVDLTIRAGGIPAQALNQGGIRALNPLPELAGVGVIASGGMATGG